jgi:hypothetical protein
VPYGGTVVAGVPRRLAWSLAAAADLDPAPVQVVLVGPRHGSLLGVRLA